MPNEHKHDDGPSSESSPVACILAPATLLLPPTIHHSPHSPTIAFNDFDFDKAAVEFANEEAQRIKSVW